MNKCIVGALILLFLGSLFLSGEFLLHLSQPASLLLLFMDSTAKLKNVYNIHIPDKDAYHRNIFG